MNNLPTVPSLALNVIAANYSSCMLSSCIWSVSNKSSESVRTHNISCEEEEKEKDPVVVKGEEEEEEEDIRGGG